MASSEGGRQTSRGPAGGQGKPGDLPGQLRMLSRVRSCDIDTLQAAAQNQHDRPGTGAGYLCSGMYASLKVAEWSAPGTEQTTSVSLKGHCKDRVGP